MTRKERIMNKIEELLHRYCPNGVAYKNLGDVCEFQRGSSITQKNVTHGTVPVIAGGQTPAYYHNTSNRIGDVIAVSASGAYAGFVSYWTVPVFLSDSFSVNPNSKILVKKYVYYFLKHNQSRIHDTKKGSGVPHVHGSSISKIPIPIPPLPVQHEIVNILDKFTQLEAQLEAELEARKVQYVYYRKLLLNYQEKEVEWIILLEVIEKIKNVKWSETDKSYKYIDLSSVSRDTYQIIGHTIINKKDAPSRAQQIINSGDILFGTTRPTLKRICIVDEEYDSQICSSGFCVIRPKKEKVLSKWIYYQLSLPKFYEYIERNQQGASYPSISDICVKEYRIPLPDIEEQYRIVQSLDKFDSLVNDLSIGLPAEIAARKKQYEYYRNKLLTF